MLRLIQSVGSRHGSTLRHASYFLQAIVRFRITSDDLRAPQTGGTAFLAEPTAFAADIARREGIGDLRQKLRDAYGELAARAVKMRTS